MLRQRKPDRIDRLRRRVALEEGPPRIRDVVGDEEGGADSLEDLRSEAEEHVVAGGWPYKGKRVELIPEREPLAGRTLGNDPVAGVEGGEGKSSNHDNPTLHPYYNQFQTPHRWKVLS